jgi:hypothetical protein
VLVFKGLLALGMAQIQRVQLDGQPLHGFLRSTNQIENLFSLVPINSHT